MNRKDIIVIIVSIATILLIVVALYFARPTVINNNYTIQTHQGLENKDYYINQQLENYKNDLREEYIATVRDFNMKFNTMLTMLGIAVAVWVGLNIHNVVERRGLDRLIEKEKLLEQKLDETSKLANDIRNAILSLPEAVEKYYGKNSDNK